MDDNNLTKTIIENSGDAINQFYNDAIGPAAKAAGNIIALPLQVIDAALTKPKLWVAEVQYNYKKTLELLGEKMKSVPPENIVPPENYVAVPALQQISYCFDSDELRNMYANLLASSMQKDKKWEVHPSFVDIIKQLNPDEAKVLKILAAKTNCAVVSILCNNKDKAHIYALRNFSLVGYEAKCEYPMNIGVYLENLNKLGLINCSTGITYLASENLYKLLFENNFVKEEFEKVKIRKDEFNQPEYEKGYAEMTNYGMAFCNVCIK